MVHLTDTDSAMLEGEHGPAAAMAMRLVVGMANASNADHLLDITRAHIDGCLYHGQASLDFAEKLSDLGATVRVPTTLNVSSLDLLHPDIIKSDAETQRKARALMTAYTEMGATPTWTCAPYQLPQRPAFGEHIAWAESNAIVFANSVLGARTDRYGDFIDIAAAITGRAPAGGLHLDERRLATVLYDVSHFSDELKATDAFFAVLGAAIGADVGTQVPAIIGIEQAHEDQLKALGAAAGSTGAVALFHVIGITPEAPDIETATGGNPAQRLVSVTPSMLRRTRRRLSNPGAERPLRSIHLGTPHYSSTQLERLRSDLDGRAVHDNLTLYVNTGRDVLASSGLADELATLGVQVVTDTCTYVTTIVDPDAGLALTDSAKWAYYAPGNLGVGVLFGSLRECVESAVAGHLVQLDDQWN